MKFFRFLVSTPFAVIITSLIFVLMYHLIRQEELPIPGIIKEPITLPDVRDDSDPKTKIIEYDKAREIEADPPKTETKEWTLDPIDGENTAPVPPVDGREGIAIDPVLGFSAIITAVPSYPPSCQGRGIEGNAVVEFDVTNAGSVTNQRIVSATDKCFEKAALRAIGRWKYTPGLGDPSSIRKSGLRQTFTFELEE